MIKLRGDPDERHPFRPHIAIESVTLILLHIYSYMLVYKIHFVVIIISFSMHSLRMPPNRLRRLLFMQV